MEVEEMLALSARLQAHEMTLALLIAALAHNHPKLIGNMHQALQGQISVAVKNVGFALPELPAAMGNVLEALTGQCLDRIFSTASQIK